MTEVATPPPVPQPEDGLDHVWPYVKWYVQRILLTGGMKLDTSTYMSLYRTLVNICVASVPRVREGKAATRSDVMSLLYDNLKACTTAHVEVVFVEITEQVDEAMVIAYVTSWTLFNAAAKYNSHIFRYTDRHWVLRERHEGRKDVDDSYTLHLKCWKSAMSASTLAAIVSATLLVAQKQTLNAHPDYSTVRIVITSFIELGMEDEAKSVKRAIGDECLSSDIEDLSIDSDAKDNKA